MEKDALIAEITAAFDGVQREEGVSLREGEVLDEYGDAEQLAAARALDTDTRWQDVSDDDLWKYNISLTYFDAKGFRYYLPAYMTYDIRHWGQDKFDGFVLPYLILTRLTKTGRYSFTMERFSLITPPQGKAICSFLLFLVQHGYSFVDAPDALAEYWNRYLDPAAE